MVEDKIFLSVTNLVCNISDRPRAVVVTVEPISDDVAQNEAISVLFERRLPLRYDL